MGFFFNDTATTEIYTLSLHDALPISLLATLDDLAGKEIFVRKSSSYYENLVKLNATFKQQGKAAVKLTPAPETLEDEDLLEMLNAGLIKVVIVDSHKARFWNQVFPKLTLHPDVAVDTGGEIAWAIRKDSPKLKHEIGRAHV